MKKKGWTRTTTWGKEHFFVKMKLLDGMFHPICNPCKLLPRTINSLTNEPSSEENACKTCVKVKKIRGL